MDRITIGNDAVTAEIAALGAELQSLTTSDGASWLWSGDPAFWSGRSPVLFPIVGRAKDDQLRINGQTYAMGQHGFARRSQFTLEDSGPDFCRFVLDDSPASQTIYPFAFRLALEHRVLGRAIAVTAEVTNRDHQLMPFGLGFHPAFAWPLPGCDGAAHTIALDSGAEPPMVRLSSGLVQPQRLPSPFEQGSLVLDPSLFAADAMLFPDGAGAGLRYSGGKRSIHFTWENLPNLALWTKPGAGFICLEPWHGTAAELDGPDELIERPYSVVLGPGATARVTWKATLEG